jgi:hypothetical protein
MRLIVFTAGLLLTVGCTSVPYQTTTAADYPGYHPKAKESPEIARGTPSAVLDASDWYWPLSLLSKLLFVDKRIDSHEISDETVDALIRFCDDHDLGDVKIRVNAYSVGDEWRRTFRNKNIGPLWRYPLGFLAWLKYTILPGRFFGGDNYNPFSNTINLYSDAKPIAWHEAGHALDFAQRKHKGTYAFLYLIPFVNLYHEGVASDKALAYAQQYESVPDQKDTYRLLAAAYGSYIGGNLTYIAVPAYPIYLGSIAAGHLVGGIAGTVNAKDRTPDLDLNARTAKAD